MNGTWEIKVSSTASAKEIRAAQLLAEAEAYAHGMPKDEVKVVYELEVTAGE